MWLVWSHAAVVEPLFNGAVEFPGVVTRQSLDWEHVGVSEDFVLLVEEGEGLLRGLVLVHLGVIVVEESCFFDNSVMV